MLCPTKFNSSGNLYDPMLVFVPPLAYNLCNFVNDSLIPHFMIRQFLYPIHLTLCSDVCVGALNYRACGAFVLASFQKSNFGQHTLILCLDLCTYITAQTSEKYMLLRIRNKKLKKQLLSIYINLYKNCVSNHHHNYISTSYQYSEAISSPILINLSFLLAPC